MDKSPAPETQKNGKLLTLPQAAEFLKISKPTLYRLLEQEKLKGRKVGNQWRFRSEELASYLEQGPVAKVYSEIASDILNYELDYFSDRLKKLGKLSIDWSSESDSQEGRVQQLVGHILALGVWSRVSDIHIEGFQKDQSNFYLLRFRIDGVMREVREFPTELANGIISFLKNWMDMDIDSRKPQDGRIKVSLEGRPVDMRISIVPTLFGESVVLRVLDVRNIVLGLEHLGLCDKDLKQAREWENKSSGLVLVTGPTGCGKTTLLYSMIHEIAKPEKKTLTLEDPVELSLPWTNQIPLNSSVGLNFPAGIRSVLRQDPDVILVGEIRDLDSMLLTLQAALTGHLVLSVLHSPDTAGALKRISDIGVEPFIASSALIGIIAKRLVRRICPKCSKKAELSAQYLAKNLSRISAQNGFKIPKNAEFLKGKGCPDCHQTGCRGRIGIFEIMEFSAEIKESFLRGASQDEIRETAIKNGMVTLIGDGIRKASTGTASLEEVFRTFSVETS